jgi:hypothetical protein
MPSSKSKSSNSDTSHFVILTNANINLYFQTIPLDVEEITIWNYIMCLKPYEIKLKEALIIPSLHQFKKLKCVRFYNERIKTMDGTSCAGMFPASIERVFFVSCIVDDKSMNVCIYGNNFKYLEKCYTDAINIQSLLSLLPRVDPEKSTSTSRRNTYPSDTPRMPQKRRSLSQSVQRQQQRRRSRTFWDMFIDACWKPWFVWKRGPKINPERNIEMVQFVPLSPPNIEDTLTRVFDTRHTLESVNRFKKTYEFLINENLVNILIHDL